MSAPRGDVLGLVELARTRIRQGTRTLPFPAAEPEFPERFRGRPERDATRCWRSPTMGWWVWCGPSSGV